MVRVARTILRYPNTMKLATLISFTMLLAIFAPAYPTAHAYGAAQWQAAFSGNFTNSTSGARFGFWGWCDFAGSAPDGQSGTEADCQSTFYAFPGQQGANNGFLITTSVQGTAWSMMPTLMPPLPGIPPDDFFITDGTVSFTGPVFTQPPPPNCTITGQIVTCTTPTGTVSCTLIGKTLTCSVPGAEALRFYNPDTGVPAKAGHYSLANILEMVGFELPPTNHVDVQVIQLT
jgi:hypothetical protein